MGKTLATSVPGFWGVRHRCRTGRSNSSCGVAVGVWNWNHAARRFNSFYGAAKAAEKAGMPEAAAEAYANLVDLVSPDSERPEVAEARAYVASGA